MAEEVGSGSEAPEAKGIVSAKECEFQSNAEQMLASMNTLNWYPICQYIEELKVRETSNSSIKAASNATPIL